MSDTLLTRDVLDTFESATRREWLVTNGIGGFAGSTIAGANTRRYHGLLISSLRPPVERVALVSKLDAVATYRGQRFELATNEFGDGTIAPHGYLQLESFRLDGSIPVWTWLLGDALIEQRIWMAHGANTTYVAFTVLRAADRVNLELTPLCTYRDYHAQHRGHRDVLVTPVANGVRIDSFWGAQPCRILTDAGACAVAPQWYWNFRHRAESERGLDDSEDLFRPAVVTMTLAPGERGTVTLTAESREPTPADESLRSEQTRQSLLLRPFARQSDWIRQLVLAADQFVVARAVGDVSGEGRTADGQTHKPFGVPGLDSASDPTSRYSPVTSSGPGNHTVIAGYPWFSDWGRDTMIALPGLTLATRRYDIAASILRTFARFVSDGMLPNRFPDAGETPEYNTVDATLWYFVAIDEYVRVSGDRALLDELYPTLRAIVRWHQRGTRYGIRVDATDGLLRAGERGVQLTWMDAKIGDWVVTPRIGKPVEINALWCNALTIMRDFARSIQDQAAAREYASAAERATRSFNDRYWFADGGYLYDVIDGPDGDDSSLRPNQLFALSLPHPLLDNGRAKSVVDTCTRELWTPVGMRSLARTVVRSASCVPDPDCGSQRATDDAQTYGAEPRYAGRYAGGPRERDAVYHQGTAWSWLLGPFALAHFRVYRDAALARSYLEGIAAHLRDACIGQVSEIFDGDAPFTPRGCYAQAWGVAEVLRVWRQLDESEVSNEVRSEIRSEARTSVAAR